MTRGGLLALIISSASPALAEDFLLSFPVDCSLGDDCYIQQYMDRDPGPGFTDYRCSTLAYDGHKGTDFAVPTHTDMHQGVDVLAAADGTVRGLRNDMPDTGWNDDTADEVTGRECGNGVVLAHPDGWETQYCHLKQGSITVENRQEVKAGDVLGQIGYSGRTEFPHLHLSVRKDGIPVDPFDPAGTLTCAPASDNTLWVETPPYQPGGLIQVGLTDQMPDFESVKHGIPQKFRMPSDAPALIFYGFSFGTLQDDILRLRIMGPEGELVSKDNRLTRNHAQAFRAIGKRLRKGTWPEGSYIGTATLLRDGDVISLRRQVVYVSAQ